MRSELPSYSIVSTSFAAHVHDPDEPPDGPFQAGLDIRCGQPHDAWDVSEHLVAEPAALAVRVQAGHQIPASAHAERFDVFPVGPGSTRRGRPRPGQ
jgi:hypothetical protein